VLPSRRVSGFLIHLCACASSFVLLVPVATAQRPYQALPQRNANSRLATSQPANKMQPQGPIKFAGWNRSNLMSPTYRKRLSRPRARVARPELVGLAGTSNASNIQGASLSPVALPGFQLRKAMPAGFLPTSVATGDFNGDGKTDFVVANGGDNNLWLYFGKGDGTFSLPIILPITLGLSPVWVDVVDLRGIGRADLVVAESDSNSLGVFLGSGNGTFSERSVSLPASPSTLVTVDCNHDGRMDVLVGSSDGNTVAALSMLPGLGNGSFGAAVNTTTPG